MIDIVAKDCLPPTTKDYVSGRFPMSTIYSESVNFMDFSKEFASLDAIQSGKPFESKQRDSLQVIVYQATILPHA